MIFIKVNGTILEKPYNEYKKWMDKQMGKLTWQEECKKIEEFHNARQREKGVSKSGRPISNKKQGWGIRDTARELRLSVGRVSEDLLLSREGRSDPSIFEIRERKDALKIVKKNG